MPHLVVLLGHTQKPTCGVQDYATFLAEALSQLGTNVDAQRVEWAERGWIPAMLQLWRGSSEWRGRWVILQYTAGAWSRYGFPFGALVTAAILRLRGAHLAVTFHEPYSWEVQPTNWVDHVRAACQNWVIRSLYHSASKAIFADPLETVIWLPDHPDKAVFIPIGGNIPVPAQRSFVASVEQTPVKTVAVFCLSDPPRQQTELDEISHALRIVSADVPELRLVMVGRGTEEAKEQIERLFAGTGVEVLNLGIRSPEEVSRTLAESDAMLCVRGRLFPRRGSALAGIACGVPIIAYAGPAQRTPLAEAGVEFVPYQDRDALGVALARLLTDEKLQAELRARNRLGQEKYFSWSRIASRYLEALGLSGLSTIQTMPETGNPTGQTSSASAPSEHASLWLDALRGLAAVGVFASHWRDCLFQDYSQLHVHNSLWAVAYLGSGLGHQWVIVFFVLSGYLVGGSVLRLVSQGRWSWREYALNRLTRLYIVLIPALLLGGLIDLAGLRFFSASDVYTAHRGLRLLTTDPANHLSPAVLLGNYLFLQGVVVPVFGTNGPLWSLSYEFWYYLMFPMLLFALWKKTSAVGRLLSVAGLSASLFFVGWKISFMGLIWLMGVGVHWLPVLRPSTRPRRLLGLAGMVALTLGCLAWCKASHSPFADYVLGIVVVLLVYGVVHWATASPTGWIRAVIQYAAKSSYTLYLVHLPFLLLITAWIGQPRWEPTLRTVFFAGMVFLLVLLYVYGVYLMFERHTNDVKLWLRNSLRRRSVNKAMSSTEVRTA